jgi:hypothetical protein
MNQKCQHNLGAFWLRQNFSVAAHLLRTWCTKQKYRTSFRALRSAKRLLRICCAERSAGAHESTAALRLDFA